MKLFEVLVGYNSGKNFIFTIFTFFIFFIFFTFFIFFIFFSPVSVPFFLTPDSPNILDPPLFVPFCAFNGGHDVWVDVGNKAEGVRVIQSYLDIQSNQCLHIGDQFSISGNDIAARDVSPTLWICNPEETKAVLRSLLRQMEHPFLHPDDCELDGLDSEIDDYDRKRRGSSNELRKKSSGIK